MMHAGVDLSAVDLGSRRRSGGAVRGSCKPSAAGQEMIGIARVGLWIAKRLIVRDRRGRA